MKNLRDIILAGLLLAIGLVLHYITPATGTPVKPDFLLAMLFLCLLIFEDVSVGFVAGIAAGILSGITTSVPGGLIPNIVDKILTTALCLGIIRVSRKYISSYILSVIIPILGTLFSGFVFLATAILIKVLPSQVFVPAFLTAVIPATVGNVILISILFGALKQTTKLYNKSKKAA
ncbi:MAG: hypothetical protein PWR27_400 [Petroclostridium sp.]|jgi:hypothetical protein|uniref:tryptophan transporter n=1 Tax=Petroclostridium xylanilyticum TaxID=1792311 RepID=UPI000B97D768|nr:tryptophan transporter [Petroclostridium xylanilyticum]MBZ4645242.1 putative rane protein [Clostridia bacterium]MDK2809691.1 hypothetical protein [Petroclostridium sp.]